MSRVTLLVVDLCALCGLSIFTTGATAVCPDKAELPAASSIDVTVRETAGIRRFGYPVHVVLRLPRPVTDADRFRLLAGGKPVAAQFRPVPALGKKVVTNAVALDFTASPAPFEKLSYRVEYGPKVAAGPEPKGGMKAEVGKDAVTVSHSSGLTFVAPRDLRGLLREVRAGKTDYLRADSAGLWVVDKGGKRHPVGGKGTTVEVTRQGPAAAALRFEGAVALGEGRPVRSTVEMEFPRSKSWVCVTWTMADGDGLVAGVGAGLNLKVEGAPTLVDFGAGSMVYTTLRKGQRAALKAGSLTGKAAPAWQTLVGTPKAMKPFVLPAPGAVAKAEGWAHVMDRQRCTALAVEHFAVPRWEHEVAVDADGTLAVTRTFAAPGKPVPGNAKVLRLWLHFVGMPVHVGALTSPQAMLAPLEVQARPAK